MASQDAKNECNGSSATSLSISPIRTLQPTNSSTSDLVALTHEEKSLLEKHSDGKALMMAYTPDMISRIATITDRRRIFMGNAPELSLVSRLYGTNITESWLVIQINHVTEFTGVKDKLTPDTTLDLARIIISMAWFLKMSEMMLFFAYFMSGRYGKFYGTVDPLTITTALRTFLSDRQAEIAHIEQQEQQRRRLQEQQSRQENAITYEEYLRQKNGSV